MANDVESVAARLVELMEAAKSKTLLPHDPKPNLQQVRVTPRSGRPEPVPPTKTEVLANDYLSKLSAGDLRELGQMLDTMLGYGEPGSSVVS